MADSVYGIYFDGWIFNLLDNSSVSCARRACFSYIAASLLSAAIGIAFRGGIYTDFLLIFAAFLISLIRYRSILKGKRENDIDTKSVNSLKLTHEIPRKSYEAVSIPLDSTNKSSPEKNVQSDFEFNSIPIEIPKHFTEKEYAQFLIENTKEYAQKINSSTDVTDFVSCLKMIKENLEELAWLNEEKKIFMYPTPRNDFQKIYNNIENTINDFISRAIAGIRKSGTEWVEDAEFLIWDIENDETMKHLMSDANRLRISELKEQVNKISAQEKNKNAQISHVYIEQILQDELIWRREQMGQTAVEQELDRVDKMDGHAFERWCASLLEASGFKDVEVTRGSGDQGVDVLATLDGIRYAVQCKCYASDLGNKPIQEVYAGIAIYKCQLGSVMTNRHFTSGAKELAEATGIALWDRDWIVSLLEELDDDAFPL